VVGPLTTHHRDGTPITGVWPTTVDFDRPVAAEGVLHVLKLSCQPQRWECGARRPPSSRQQLLDEDGKNRAPDGVDSEAPWTVLCHLLRGRPSGSLVTRLDTTEKNPGTRTRAQGSRERAFGCWPDQPVMSTDNRAEKAMLCPV
jgi:hypothetical protein